jgi:hypothetical protein
MGLAQVVEEASEPVGGAPVPFDLALPATGFGVGDQLPFHTQTFTQPGRVLRCGDEAASSWSGTVRSFNALPAARRSRAVPSG